ncbi:unnamed protein product [Protopolystoma xenopodis]|uniref:Uncharacterized protein n=1 Tax=Protopolystoma xenopodis TaxID=117903 RepID=A0A3S5FFC5_9PLAT|nr:unnamed protein product [Protopolystoma xenopodis]
MALQVAGLNPILTGMAEIRRKLGALMTTP